jgi:UDP-N-acetylmuramoyl-tripeptide--D-alanyl-D-alanine ligase
MKKAAITCLEWLLKKIARGILWRYRPGIIGVTGSVGKTSTKIAIAKVLGGERHVRASPESHNNTFGLPLTIIGEWAPEELGLVSKETAPGAHALRKGMFWLKVVVLGIYRTVVKTEYPEILILEYGIDRPGDMKRLIAIARPNLTVMTAIGEIPVHVEFFDGPEQVAREKARLIECLPSASFAVLNFDNEVAMDLRDRTRAHVVTFGFESGADVQVNAFEYRVQGERPVGIGFKLAYGGTVVPVKIDGVFGRAHGYAAAAAAAVGLIFGIHLVKIAEALKEYSPAHGRMELLPGVKGSYVIHDAYNASPLSMHAALDALKQLPGKRKIAVLGDMLEIGKYAMDAHEEIGRRAAREINVLVTVGPRAKFIAEGARKAGMRKSAIFSFDEAEGAVSKVQELIRKGDLGLVKGSRAMRLEKIVEGVRVF